MDSLESPIVAPLVSRHVGGIPVRNLWLLMLYASELFRKLDKSKIAVEQNPDDIPDLIAEFLVHEVERRLRRNLSFGYRRQEAVLSRVRGRIDGLTTERRQLLARGKVACRFETLTVNTPRNRFVRAALATISRFVRRSELAHRCRILAASMERIGVTGVKPTRSEMSTDRITNKDLADQTMLAAAQLAFDLALPTEETGMTSLALPYRDVIWIRRLYEKAIGGFYSVTLKSAGWRVETGKTIGWQIEQKSSGIDDILPAMRTDIVLDHFGLGRRIVIDTKFNAIVTHGWYRETSLRSSYIYQIYAYLRSQEGNGELLEFNSSGMLLHPSVGATIDEKVTIQGHQIRFATVNLGSHATEIRAQLLKVIS